MYDKMINRTLIELIQSKWFSGKTMLLLGARQVGKTTLLKQLSQNLENQIIWLNADNPEDRALLNGLNGQTAKILFPPDSVVLFDEAQRLENSGLTLKIIHDNCPDIQLLATGSSSFELSDKIKEALTGRKWTFNLFPLSIEELVIHTNAVEVIRSLETRLLYGSYPEVVVNAGNEREVLNELVSDYLYKDVFALKDLRKPEALEKLLQAIAFQIGSQVSYRELASLVGIDKETVERYIWLLEEAFIIFRVPSFARNLRNELKKSRKIYFYDLGVRNALLQQFSPLTLRNDVGQLWENFLIVERLKLIEYHRQFCNTYFWRTTAQQEIDYLEERDGQLSAFEFKWNPKKKVRIPSTFSKAYPDANTQVIHKDNFLEFVLK